MPRAGLNTDRVVAEAMELADEAGLDQLTLAALAVRLGVRQPSLYKHVASLDALQRLISMEGKVEAADVLAQADVSHRPAGVVGERQDVAVAGEPVPDPV